MIKKFLLAMESITEELTMGMQSKCETLTLTIHLRVAVQLILQHLTALIKKLHLQQVEAKGSRLMSEEFRENRQEGAKILKSKFPNWNPLDSSFNATLNSRGEVEVMLTDTSKAVPHVIIDADGNVNEGNKEVKEN